MKSIEPQYLQGYSLLHEGAKALSEVETHGIQIDEGKLRENKKKVKNKIKRLEQKLYSDAVWHHWKNRYGRAATLGNRQQLASVLYEEMEFSADPSALTDRGRPKMDEESLEKIDLPFIHRYLLREKYRKALSTYLNGIERETVDGLLHPIFNLHLAQTFRSSSDSPNFQNIPVRLPWISKLIRTCFISRPGHRLVEIDYGGIEVCVSACVHRDPAMIRYVSDKDSDMHRDTAGDLFLIPTSEVPKSIRKVAKSCFVFAEFYGDWYKNCAKNIWSSIDGLKLQLSDGTPLKDHLKTKGIKRLGLCDPKSDARPGTFEKHCQDVERMLWHERFVKYREWKEKSWERYQRTCEFELVTGFKIRGLYGRNEITNYPIQGPAFHCLLWSLIHLNRWLKANKMRSLIVGQIHDSIVADVCEEELDDFLYMANKIMTRMLPRVWRWICVPLEVEAEVSPPGGSWYDKQEISL